MADIDLDFAAAVGALIKGVRWVRPFATITDANTVTTPGVHPISSSHVANIANRPTGTRTATAGLIVTPLQNNVIHQEWRQYEGAVWRRWERSRPGGSWTAWVDITPGASTPTPPADTTPARSSTTSIACIGDSLTDGYSNAAQWVEADSYPAQLGAWLGTGYTVTNLGFSGATTDQINLRVGALPLHMRVTGGSINAVGTTNLTSDQVVGAWGGDIAYSLYGYLGGIHGLLQYTPGSGYVFTRATSGTAISGATATFEGEHRAHATSTIVYLAGRNDISKGTAGMEATIPDHVIRGNVDLMTYATPRRKQVVLCGTITRTDEAPGSAGFEAVQEISTRLRLLYPANFVDVQGYLTGAGVWADTGITPTQADTDAQAQGMTPPSLFDDTTHYSRTTARALAERLIGPFLKQKGWV